MDGNEPQLETRQERPYAAVGLHTSMQDEPATISHGLAALHAWLAARGVAATGAPFVRYHEIEMPVRLRIEVCMPVPPGIAGDGTVSSGTVPGGRYLVLRHVGPPASLVEANARLQRWAQRHGHAFDAHRRGDVTTWGARLETALSDPAAVPDPALRVTEIAYRLAASGEGRSSDGVGFPEPSA